MIVFWAILGTFFSSVIGYLIGSFNFSIFITKIFYQIDIRQVETRNPGANNVRLVVNNFVAGLILVLDGLKIMLAMFCAVAISMINIDNVNFTHMTYYCAGLFAIVGHCLPIYYRFHGGKGVACFFGFVLMINPIIMAIAIVLWWAIYFIKRNVLVSSSIMMGIIFFIVWIPWLSLTSTISWDYHTIINSKVLWFNQFHKYNNSGYYDNLILINIFFDISLIFTMLINIFWNKLHPGKN